MRSNLFKVAAITLVVGSFFSCSPTQWEKTGEIPLEGVAPIGLAPASNGNFWISDGDHNRVLLIDSAGKILTEHKEIERPMHMESAGGSVFVASYGSDEILQLTADRKEAVALDQELDAPAAYSKSGKKEAIADFYSHSILMNSGSGWKRIGEKGQTNGLFHYPTDLQWHKNKLYVADAYNHRVQVFDANGKHLLTFGEDEDMNASTGIFVTDENVLITDFENSRILVYTIEGKFEYAVEEGVEKPTDIYVDRGTMYVTNYSGNSISVFGR